MSYTNFSKNCKEMMYILKKESDRIIKSFNKTRIFYKSLPVKTSKKCNTKQKGEINNFLKSLFYPIFDVITPLIQDGLLISKQDVWHDRDDDWNFVNNIHDIALGRLYTFLYLKYNLNLSLIMQFYLLFEQNLINYLHEEKKFSKNSLFDVCAFLEKEDIIIDSKIKDKLYMYKCVINVYKHGYGESYNIIRNKYPYILTNQNETNNKTTDDKNFAFVFNLDKISIKEIYDTIISFLKCLD